MRHARLTVLLALLGLLGGGAARAADTEVDVALVLAVDVSASVSAERWELQKRGYAEAFRRPEIANAISTGPRGAIAVTMVEWSGAAEQRQVIAWRILVDGESTTAFAAAISETPRVFSGSTSLSGAIDFSMRLLEAAEFKAARRVIDVSGDGSNNDGRSVNLARDEAVAKGITINGLPILASERNLDVYYREQVIGGPGAFEVVANSYGSFAAAILKKLLLEIASMPRDAREVGTGLP